LVSTPAPALQPSAARNGLVGFFLSGLLTSFLGAILPAWRYHIEPDFLVIGTYFLCQNAGLLAAFWVGNRFLARRGLKVAFLLGCALAAGGLLVLSLFSPPSPALWRMAGLLLIGCGAGLFNSASFQAITPAYEIDPVATLNIAGALFGLGCFLSAVLVAGTFFVYTVPSIVALIAAVPALAAAWYSRSAARSGVLDIRPASVQELLRQLRNPAAVLLALFLFFQFGNEWALAGWLPVFLTQRLGLSPGTSLFLLALYWMALLVGRLLGQWILPRVNHVRLLLGAAVAPMFGCFVLVSTDNLFGAITGVLLAGGGFSLIYPLAAEKVGDRFPGFHPGVFSGIFSIAITGAQLAPASVGYLADWLGNKVVMGLPLAGSVLVLILLLLILLEAKLSGNPTS
jgi:MFS transporter, FHS family, glucose/mannose:H+ symporter